MATGLLVVLIGAYARLAPYLTSASKCYEATISFGSETDTDDAEGAVTRRAAVPAELMDRAHARAVLAPFLGASMQTPPTYSAIKVGGKTAHREARAGTALELAPRPMEVLAADLLATEAAAASWSVAFDVSKGTYIRALARDIGRACGSAAHLSALRRTTSGTLTLADAHTMEDMEAAVAEGRFAGLLVDPVLALGLPTVAVDLATGRHGSSFAAPADATLSDGSFASVVRDGVLAGVYRVVAGRLEPAVVLPTGVDL
jgi:tRNA pseudouridine55 synthase